MLVIKCRSNDHARYYFYGLKDTSFLKAKQTVKLDDNKVEIHTFNPFQAKLWLNYSQKKDLKRGNITSRIYIY